MSADKKEKIIVKCIQEINIHDEMQDSCLSIYYDGGTLQAVFDGHGGDKVSKFCSDNLVKSMDKFKEIKYPDRLTEVICDLHKQIISNSSYDNQGSTAIITYTQMHESETIIYVACVGDSRAMIVDKDKGKIMKKNDLNDIVITDAMANEFDQYNIRSFTTNNEYCTRAHFYEGKDIPEYMYYIKATRINFTYEHKNYYMKCGMRQLQPVRSLGDKRFGPVIYKPELYTWKLSSQQLKNSMLIHMSDGVESHHALCPYRFARLISKPQSFTTDFSYFLNGTFLQRNNKITEKNLQVSLLDSLFNILTIHKSYLKHDLKWQLSLDKAFIGFEKLYTTIMKNSSMYDDLNIILQMIVYIIMMFNGDDNITIMCTYLNGVK